MLGVQTVVPGDQKPLVEQGSSPSTGCAFRVRHSLYGQPALPLAYQQPEPVAGTACRLCSTWQSMHWHSAVMILPVFSTARTGHGVRTMARAAAFGTALSRLSRWSQSAPQARRPADTKSSNRPARRTPIASKPRISTWATAREFRGDRSLPAARSAVAPEGRLRHHQQDDGGGNMPHPRAARAADEFHCGTRSAATTGRAVPAAPRTGTPAAEHAAPDQQRDQRVAGDDDHQRFGQIDPDIEVHEWRPQIIHDIDDRAARRRSSWPDQHIGNRCARSMGEAIARQRRLEYEDQGEHRQQPVKIATFVRLSCQASTQAGTGSALAPAETRSGPCSRGRTQSSPAERPRH